MSTQAMRAERKALVVTLRGATNTGFFNVVTDLLRLEIEEAHTEMEHADDEKTIWRAQGRAAGARNLLDAITKKPRDAAE